MRWCRQDLLKKCWTSINNTTNNNFVMACQLTLCSFLYLQLINMLLLFRSVTTHLGVVVVFVLATSLKGLRFIHFRSDWNEIWQEYSVSHYASTDRYGFSIWRYTFKKSAATWWVNTKCLPGAVQPSVPVPDNNNNNNSTDNFKCAVTWNRLQGRDVSRLN